MVWGRHRTGEMLLKEQEKKKKATKYSEKKTSNQRHVSKIRVTVLKLLSETTELRLCCRDNNSEGEKSFREEKSNCNKTQKENTSVYKCFISCFHFANLFIIADCRTKKKNFQECQRKSIPGRILKRVTYLCSQI